MCAIELGGNVTGPVETLVDSFGATLANGVVSDADGALVFSF